MATRRLLARARQGLVVVVAAIALAGCNSDPAAPVAAGLDLGRLNPANPGPDYVPATNQADQTALIQQMWTTMTAPACWDASAASPVAAVTQFQFFGQNEFRHYGFSIYFGVVFLHSVGHYQGRPAAIVETWTGVVEAIVILDSSTLAHIFPNPANTAQVVTRYGTSNGPCL